MWFTAFFNQIITMTCCYSWDRRMHESLSRMLKSEFQRCKAWTRETARLRNLLLPYMQLILIFTAKYKYNISHNTKMWLLNHQLFHRSELNSTEQGLRAEDIQNSSRNAAVWSKEIYVNFRIILTINSIFDYHFTTHVLFFYLH